MAAGDNKLAFANLLSYLATVWGKVTMAGCTTPVLITSWQEGERECLKFKLEGTLTVICCTSSNACTMSHDANRMLQGLEDWGHEYSRHLCAEATIVVFYLQSVWQHLAYLVVDARLERPTRRRHKLASLWTI